MGSSLAFPMLVPMFYAPILPKPSLSEANSSSVE